MALATGAFVLAFTLSWSRSGDTSAAVQAPATPYLGSVSPHTPLPRFALRDQFGRPARSAEFRGKPLLIAFVYSLCTDVCPLTASRIAWALDRLGPEARQLNVIAITVQPQIDTRRRVIAFSLKHHLLHRWRYLIGPPSTVLPLLKEFGVAPEQLPPPGSSSSPRNGDPGAHGAWIFLADAGLRRVESWPQNLLLDPHDLLHDLRLLIRGVSALPRPANG